MEQEQSKKKEEEETKDAETWSSLTKDFCGYTSAHGLERIMSSKEWVRKAFWSLLFIGAVVVLGIQVYALFEKYQRRPLNTLITLKSDTSLPFPAVTLCNFNAIRYDALLNSNFTDLIDTIKKQNSSSNSTSSRKRRSSDDNNGGLQTTYAPTPTDDYPTTDDYGDDSWWDDDDYDLWGDEEVDDPNYLDPEFFASEKVSLLLAQQDESYLSSLGHQFEDMVLSCTYRGISCSNFTEKFWSKFWHYKYGNCYVFNMGLTSSGSKSSIVKSNKAGPSHGLNLEINIEQDDYLDHLTPEAGIKLDISNQGYMPFPLEKGLSLPVGFASTIGLRKVNIKRQDPFNNHRCHENTAPDKSNLYTKIFNVNYSSTACKESCLAKHQSSQCGCMEYRFPVDKEPVCNITEKTVISCLNKLQKMYRNNELNCSSSCPPPCRQEEFKVSTSYAVWPSERYEGYYQAELEKRGKFVWADGSYRKNVLKVQVFYEELNVELITEERSYELADFASDIGGQLGLWIGFSVLTIAEFLEFLALLCFLVVKKCSSGSKVSSIKMEMKGTDSYTNHAMNVR